MALTIPSPGDLYEAGKAEAQGVDDRLQDFRDGSGLDGLNGSAVALADEVIGVGLAEFRKAYLLTTNDRDDVVRRIQDHDAQFTPRPAGTATVQLVVSRADLDPYSGSHVFEAGTEATGTDKAGDEVTFTLASTVVLSGAADDVTLTFDAPEAGRDHNNASGFSIDGLPDGLDVTQPEPSAGGADEESVVEMISRFREWQRAGQMRATKEGLEVGAREVGGVTFAYVNTAHAADPEAPRVELYIGDPDAGANEPLRDLVQAHLDLSWIGGGDRVEVLSSTRDEREFTVRVTVPEDVDIAEQDVKDALLAWTDSLAPGRSAWLSQGEGDVHQALAEVLNVDIELTSDATVREVTPTAAYQAIRTQADGTQITVVITEDS